ncbi:inactive peptidyl-prolyl cis-trans isomerase FKBP6 isoform X1 [Astyanax mexicanus]|uniref:inactive peptidyl-prolyl cis-trans isomerase FKBP6 isoform X1 n=1 Tax=Astyanax mexicanus TaxID=7994 RepID=UPI000BBDCE72|nr:inactive peptidyl-prolyl cis-trans isomerase FKBP6 isoform X1 [Astyanax mexicanus]
MSRIMQTNGVSTRIRQFIHPEELHREGIQTPFQRLARQMHDVLGDGGIFKEVIRAGDGPAVQRDSTVSVNFSAFLEYADQPFDSSTHLKFPKMMKLGKDMTLCGLELGLLTMRKGECSRFLFKHDYAFGEMGCPPLIPPLAMVLYEVQVLDFFDTAQVDNFFALTVCVPLENLWQEEQNSAPLSTLLSVIDTEKSFGNRCFNQSRYEDAKDRYKQAVTLLQNREPMNEEERWRIEEAMLPFLLNLSFTYLRLERPQKALQYGKKALKINPNSTKALFRCGQACLEMDDYDGAQDYLTRAQAKKPFDIDINNLLRKLATCYKDCLDKEKDLCAKMFSGFRPEK